MQHYRVLVGLEKTPPEEVPVKVAQLQERGWSWQERVPARWVVIFSKEFDDHDAALAARGDVREVMAECWVSEHELAVDDSVAPHLEPAHSYIIAPDVGPDQIKHTQDTVGKILAGGSDGTIVKLPGGVAAKPDEKDKTETTKADADGALPVAPPRGETAELAHQGLAAVGVPSKAWTYLGSERQKELAEEVLREVYASRLDYARRIAWTFAPPFELLERVPQADREQLAEDILRIREGLATEQVEMRQKDVQLKEKDVELKAGLVDQETVATDMLKEVLEQMKKWKSLANWGVGLLVVTVLFAMAMTGWVIAFAGDKIISDWALGPAIFALALFAVSPAVLLLLQRPLKGIDEWTPGSKAETVPAATAPAATTSQQPSPSQPSAAQTSTSTKPAATTAAPNGSSASS